MLISAVEVRHPPPKEAEQIPLCVDLDGTLIRTDVLFEGLLGVLCSRRRLQNLPELLTFDRARLKRNVAALEPIDVSVLPYNEPLLAYLRAQKEDGRRLVLVTAADSLLAHAIADHLGLFDEVIASDGVRNLKGEAKAQALIEQFGARGFAYAGNDRADVAVWRVARQAVVVNAKPRVRGMLRQLPDTPAEAEFTGRRWRRRCCTPCGRTSGSRISWFSLR